MGMTGAGSGKPLSCPNLNAPYFGGEYYPNTGYIIRTPSYCDLTPFAESYQLRRNCSCHRHRGPARGARAGVPLPRLCWYRIHHCHERVHLCGWHERRCHEHDYVGFCFLHSCILCSGSCDDTNFAFPKARKKLQKVNLAI